jgi:hypothetical protein
LGIRNTGRLSKIEQTGFQNFWLKFAFLMHRGNVAALDAPNLLFPILDAAPLIDNEGLCSSGSVSSSA